MPNIESELKVRFSPVQHKSYRGFISVALPKRFHPFDFFTTHRDTGRSEDVENLRRLMGCSGCPLLLEDSFWSNETEIGPLIGYLDEKSKPATVQIGCEGMTESGRKMHIQKGGDGDPPCINRYSKEQVVNVPLRLKAPEFITDNLHAEIVQAHKEVMNFDKLAPREIRKAVAVPHVRVGEDGQQVTLGWITLGQVSEGFTEYIKELKNPQSDSFPLFIGTFELAIFLHVLKQHEPLKNLRDFFTDEFDGWHQRFQGSSLKASFTRLVNNIRQERRFEFYNDADFMEQLVQLTDYVHSYCLVTPPFHKHPTESFGLTGEKSWFDIYDGKSIGYEGRILSYKRDVN